jgi:hypothetical protein
VSATGKTITRKEKRNRRIGKAWPATDELGWYAEHCGGVGLVAMPGMTAGDRSFPPVLTRVWHALPRLADMSAKWEYFFESLSERKLSTEHLNMRAAEGWELLSTDATDATGTTYYALFWRR